MKRLVKDFEEMDPRDIILKNDGEPSMAAQTKLQSVCPGRNVQVNPPVYDPRSNGACEQAVQDLTAQTRVLKLALEARLCIEMKT